MPIGCKSHIKINLMYPLNLEYTIDLVQTINLA
jgi:hypothetical protein